MYEAVKLGEVNIVKIYQNTNLIWEKVEDDGNLYPYDGIVNRSIHGFSTNEGDHYTDCTFSSSSRIMYPNLIPVNGSFKITINEGFEFYIGYFDEEGLYADYRAWQSGMFVGDAVSIMVSISYVDNQDLGVDAIHDSGLVVQKM